MKYVYYGLLLAGLLILLARWKNEEKGLHLFVPMYICILIAEGLADWTKLYTVYHINQTISCMLLSIYYYQLFTRRVHKTMVVAGFITYIVFCIVYFSRYPSRFSNFDPIDFVAEGVFITIFSLFYLVDLYRATDNFSFKQNPHFWIAAGNLIFYPGASIFMGFAFYLMRGHKQLYTQLSYIVYFLNLALYSVYIKAFLCKLPTKNLA